MLQSFDKYYITDREIRKGKGGIFYHTPIKFTKTSKIQPVDSRHSLRYTTNNSIGQFVTILSVNKTREEDGHFVCPFFVGGIPMNKKTRYLAHGALIAAMYVALTYLQNFLVPNSTSMAIQFRVSEALCVLALFTPAAIGGLSVGCLIYNVSYAASLPLDFLVGTLATLTATAGMWLGRRVTAKGYPLLSILLPSLTNALLVGWELSVYIGGGFWLNALYVAIGEGAVLLTLGSALYYIIRARKLDRHLYL